MIPVALLVESVMEREPPKSLNVAKAGVRQGVYPESNLRTASVEHYAVCLPVQDVSVSDVTHCRGNHGLLELGHLRQIESSARLIQMACPWLALRNSAVSRLSLVGGPKYCRQSKGVWELLKFQRYHDRRCRTVEMHVLGLDASSVWNRMKYCFVRTLKLGIDKYIADIYCCICH